MMRSEVEATTQLPTVRTRSKHKVRSTTVRTSQERTRKRSPKHRRCLCRPHPPALSQPTNQSQFEIKMTQLRPHRPSPLLANEKIPITHLPGEISLLLLGRSSDMAGSRSSGATCQFHRPRRRSPRPHRLSILTHFHEMSCLNTRSKHQSPHSPGS